MQRPLRKPSNKTHIVVAGIDDQWSADLMDVVKFSKYNDGFAYVLVVIDVFSKYLWLRKLKDKKGDSVARAFQRWPSTEQNSYGHGEGVQIPIGAENIQKCRNSTFVCL